jgi:hypothetical protein
MKRIAIAAAFLLSAITPAAAVHAAPAPAPATVAAAQSYVEYLGSVEIGGVVYDVFYVEDLGGGWY